LGLKNSRESEKLKNVAGSSIAKKAKGRLKKGRIFPTMQGRRREEEKPCKITNIESHALPSNPTGLEKGEKEKETVIHSITSIERYGQEAKFR